MCGSTVRTDAGISQGESSLSFGRKLKLKDDSKGSMTMNTQTIEQYVHVNSENKVANVRETVRQMTLKTLLHIETAVDEVRSAPIKGGKHTLRSGGALLAATASGMLAGIAERLEPASAKPSDESKPDNGN